MTEIRTVSVTRLTGPPVLLDCEVVNGRTLFEGDIVIEAGTPHGLEAVAVSGDRFRWRNGVVPFEIEAAVPDQGRITGAIAHWEASTGLRFRARAAGDDSFITFVRGENCTSAVGRRGGRQSIEVGPDCSRGNIIHEIGHAAGLWHEQSRGDRDRFITINFSNIQPNRVHNFNQHISDGDDIGPYDYGSIMHYPAGAFAIDASEPTIIAPQPIGQRTGLSPGDIAAIRALYRFRRLGDSGSQAGEVSEIAAVRTRTVQAVTAVRTAAATLRLITWRVGADGAVTRTGDSGDAAADASDLAIGTAGRFVVTACRAKNGDHKLISWTVTEAGAVSRTADSGTQAGDATLNRLVTMSPTLLVSACRRADGTLALITWQVAANGAITRRHDSGDQAGAVTEIATTAISSRLLATAVRAGDGTLKVIVWDVAPDGTVTRRGDSGSQAGAARMIRVVRAGSGHLVTAVRAGDGRLTLISWAVSADGRTVTRAADTGEQAGIIEDNALLNRAPGVVSAVRADNGNLKLIAWTVDQAGRISRDGDSYDLAGAARSITVADDPFATSDPIVTAVRAADGSLKLITWQD